MFVKSLRLHGFKSFADRIDLDFTQGITCVVGPNGSGKSNIVDALSWVMGSQAARQLRGDSMEDVIFSGTPARDKLGRAEVTLTIDNARGAIPIDVAEIAISRTLFRSGDSRYMVNGEECRLLDIVELLADAGVGRQMHNLVGQGHIEKVIMAQPEDRRVTIEEAAGVLKHRKRRERALRRLESAEADLVRLEDVRSELMRRLRPLARQVKGAERYEILRAELTQLGLWRAGEEIRTGTRELELAREYEQEVRARLATLRAQRGADSESVASLEETARETQTDVEVARGHLERMERIVGRVFGLGQVATERKRGLDERRGAIEDRRDGGLDIDAERADAADRAKKLGAEADAIEERAVRYEDDMRAHAVLRTELDAAWRAAGLDGDARRSALEAQQAAAHAGLARADADHARLADRQATLSARLVEIDELLAETNTEIERLDAASTPLAERQESAEVARQGAVERAEKYEESHRRWAAEAASLRARSEALEAAVAEGSGTKRARWVLDERFGKLPRVRDLVHVESGAELAVAAGLGALLHAVLMPDGTAATAAGVVKEVNDAALPLAVRPAEADDGGSGNTEAAGKIGALALEEVVAAVPGPHHDTVTALIRVHGANIYVARDTDQAIRLSGATRSATFVTPDGDRCIDGLLTVRSGSKKHNADPALGAAKAIREADDAGAHADKAQSKSEAAREQLRQINQESESLGRELADLDSALTSRAETLAVLERERDDIGREREATAAQIESAAQAQEAERARRDDIAARLDDEAPAPADQLREELEAKKSAIDARGDELRAESLRIEAERARVSERRHSIEIRLAELDRLESERERRREDIESESVRVQEETVRISEISELVTAVHIEAVRRRDHARHVLMGAESTRSSVMAELDQTRERLRGHDTEIQEVSEARHAAELAESECRMRLDAARQVPGRDLGAKVKAALDAVLPEDVEPDSVDGRLETLDGQLSRIGPVNPLAIEEHAELEARRDELDSELDDVKNAKREIVKVVREVDDKIAGILADAYADVGRQFSDMFALLFPGGEGRIVLTDPTDVLKTGIEIEARPSGKSPKRLSLLSGGERSLSSLAFLFAVFRARPSPFYVLDEVEAALDDVNLHRFCNLLRDFRGDSQLLIVSHQKRTMETADVLYGVSLGDDGTSRVIGQSMSGLDLSDEAIERQTSSSG